MMISIIVCTYNRAHNLENCVRHIKQQKNLQAIDWELLIVDNNSSDNTQEVVQQLIQSNAADLSIRYIFESQQGLSYARNRGIKEAQGSYLIFTDDDISVSENWLRAIYDGFEVHQADGVGGRIWLEQSIRLPAWINEDMYGFLGYRDFGDAGFVMDGIRQFPFGGNMAVRKQLVEAVGDFDTRMGRKGEGKKADELFKGEETDFFHRIATHGGKLYYAPDAIVTHHILGHQLKKRFFRTLHYNAGMQKALLDNTLYDKRLMGVPLFIFRQLLDNVLKYLTQLVTQGISLSFRQQMNVMYFIGMIRGYSK